MNTGFIALVAIGVLCFIWLIMEANKNKDVEVRTNELDEVSQQAVANAYLKKIESNTRTIATILTFYLILSLIIAGFYLFGLAY